MLAYLLNSRTNVIFIIPFILGALTVFSFQPFNFTFINFLIIPLIFFLILYVKKKSKNIYRKKPYLLNLFLLGYIFGIGYFLTGTYWISNSLSFDDNLKFLIPFTIILLPIFLGLFFGLATLLVGPFIRNDFTSILIFSSSFGTIDFLRGKLLSGFPWNLWVYSWSWSLETIQSLKFIGLYAGNLICVAFFCLPALFFFKKQKKNFILGTIFILIFFMNYIFGSISINKNNEIINNYNYYKNNFISVKIVSPSFDLKYNLTNTDTEELLVKLIKFSEPVKSKSTIFVWPEGVFTGSNFKELKKYKSLFKSSFSKNHLIIFGVNTEKEENLSMKTFNSLIVTNNNLDIIYQYDKQKLVPFGEFLPMENVLKKLGLKKVTEGYGAFSKGSKQPLLNIEGFKIQPLICYEIIFPNLSEQHNYKNLIINISEDAWFGDSIGPQQHFAKAIFRAVENNVFLIRSANKGISAFIDNKGVIRKSLSPSETGSIELDIPIISNSSKKIKKDLIFFILLFTYVLIFVSLKNKIND